MIIMGYFQYQILKKESGWSKNVFKLVNGISRQCIDECIIVVGDNVPTYKEVLIKMDVEVLNTRWETQFSIISWKEIVPLEEKAIVDYLSSGMIKGVGKIMANRIYQKFGKDALNVIEKQPDRLKEVEGITEEKFCFMMQSCLEKRKMREFISDLRTYGLDTKSIMQIYNTVGSVTSDLIKLNPYILFEMNALDFKKCDSVALKMGISADNKFRVKAGCLEVLKRNEEKGNTCMLKDDMGSQMQQLLKVPSHVIGSVFKEMLVCREIKITNGYVFRPITHEVETNLAKELVRLSVSDPWPVDFDIEEEIAISEKKHGIQLHTNQRIGVKEALKNQMVVITGGPGTGKTALMVVLTDIIERKYPDKKMLLMAPTGKAARRLSESTKRDACTVHAGVSLPIDLEEKIYYLGKELHIDFSDIDEASMLDIWITYGMAKAMPTGSKVIFVGDIDQLSSVGPGAILRDVINSGICPVVILEHVFRQEEGGTIDLNCKKMIHNNSQLEWDGTFRYHPCHSSENFEQIAKLMEDIYVKEVSQRGIENVLLLCPYRKNGEASAFSMNERLQKRLNSDAKKEWKMGKQIIRLGDPVMHLTNENDVCNGDIGIVKDIYERDGRKACKVSYFGTYVKEYVGDERRKLMLAYAMTVHKAQGSEAPSVIFGLGDNHRKEMKTRNIVYTATSRAKETFHFVGSKRALEEAIHCPDEVRITMLSQRIKCEHQKYLFTGIL